jgi:D-glycero-alpha-D-manno-heptose-7-phosphate kinase
MILAKTPLRLSFLGGGTDFPDWYGDNMGMVISTAINKYCFVLIRTLPPYFNFNYRLRYFYEEKTIQIHKIKHSVIKEIFKRKFTKNSKLELIYFGDVPALSGLGSSSAFTVSLLNASNAYNEIKNSKKKLAEEAINFEQNILGEPVGSQDQISTAYGGFNIIKFKNNNFFVSKLNLPASKFKNLENNILLVYTGISRYSKKIEKEKINNIKKNQELFKEMYSLCNEAANKIKISNDLTTVLPEYIKESWIIKKKIGKFVTNEKINDLYNFGMNNGALAGKILGAGSGGFMLFLFDNPVLKNKLKNKLKKNVCLEVKFDWEGSKIISNHYDPYKKISIFKKNEKI